MKNLIKLLVAAIVTTASFSTVAQDGYLGTVTPAGAPGGTYFYNFSNGGSNFDAFANHFTDTLNFSIGVQSIVTGFFETGNPAARGLTLNEVVIPGDPLGYDFMESDSIRPFMITRTLDAGDYQFVFKRTRDNAFTGAINIAAVPEPETYALMLAGLALVGFSARRRQA